MTLLVPDTNMGQSHGVVAPQMERCAKLLHTAFQLIMQLRHQAEEDVLQSFAATTLEKLQLDADIEVHLFSSSAMVIIQ